MKNDIFQNRDKKIRYLIFVLTTLFLFSGCGLTDRLHQKEIKEELEIFGFTQGSNPKIKEAQNYLQKAGFNPGAIDGKIGWQTRKAVKEFQEANKLKTTGFINSKTWAKLNTYKETSQPSFLFKSASKNEIKKIKNEKTDSSLQKKKEVQDGVMNSQLK